MNAGFVSEMLWQCTWGSTCLVGSFRSITGSL